MGSVSDRDILLGFLRGGRIIRVEGKNLDVVQQPLIKAILDQEEEAVSGGSRKKRDCDSFQDPHIPLTLAPPRPCVNVGDLLEVSAEREGILCITGYALEALRFTFLACKLSPIFYISIFLYFHSVGNLAVPTHPLSFSAHPLLCHPMLVSVSLFLSWMGSVSPLAMQAGAKISPTNRIPISVGQDEIPLGVLSALNLAMSWI